jgi:hypothetical protein
MLIFDVWIEEKYFSVHHPEINCELKTIKV